MSHGTAAAARSRAAEDQRMPSGDARGTPARPLPIRGDSRRSSAAVIWTKPARAARLGSPSNPPAPSVLARPGFLPLRSRRSRRGLSSSLFLHDPTEPQPATLLLFRLAANSSEG